MAYEKQTFVDRVVDENGDVLVEGTVLTKAIMDHIEDGISNVAYDDLKNRPFGDIDYKDSYDFAVAPTVSFDFAGQMTFYKVSDLQLTYDELLKTVFSIENDNGTYTTTPTAEQFIFNNESIAGFQSDQFTIGVAYATGEVETDYGTVNPPEKGTYFGVPAGNTTSGLGLLRIVCNYVKKIDEKYLPFTNGNEVAY